MTITELTAIAEREAMRQAAITYEAIQRGGVWDSILGRWVEWREGEAPQTVWRLAGRDICAPSAQNDREPLDAFAKGEVHALGRQRTLDDR